MTCNEQITAACGPRQAEPRYQWKSSGALLTKEDRAHDGQECTLIGGTGTWTWVRFMDGYVAPVESIDLRRL